MRGHGAFDIGTIMLVTGVAQLLMARVAVALEQRADALLLTTIRFGVFALGLGVSGFATRQTDADGMFWPQVVRGLAIMFWLLLPTRLALGHLSPDLVPDSSSLFDLIRNLGGATGLALIDTVIYSRSPFHGLDLMTRLQAGDTTAPHFVGIPPQVFAALPLGPLDASKQGLLALLLEKAALSAALNYAWLLIAVLTGVALVCVPFKRGGLPTPEKHL